MELNEKLLEAHKKVVQQKLQGEVAREVRSHSCTITSILAGFHLAITVWVVGMDSKARLSPAIGWDVQLVLDCRWVRRLGTPRKVPTPNFTRIWRNGIPRTNSLHAWKRLRDNILTLIKIV